MSDRVVPNSDPDAVLLRSIEVAFGMEVYITQEDQRELHKLISKIVNRLSNQPTHGVHWVSGSGSKPYFSAMDAAFLGVAPAPAHKRPADGDEPIFDESILHIETTARSFVTSEERDRVLKERAGEGQP